MCQFKKCHKDSFYSCLQLYYKGIAKENTQGKRKMSKTELWKKAFSILKSGKNIFWSNSDTEVQNFFDLEGQPIVEDPDPKILRKNFDILLEWMADRASAQEMSEYRRIANTTVLDCKDKFDRCNAPINYNPEAIAKLRELFSQVGHEDLLEKALKEECAVAYLHGYVDNFYDEWESVGSQMIEDYRTMADDNRHYDDICAADLQEYFPNFVFQDYGDNEDILIARGRLFSLRDYQEAKEAIGQLKDRFSRSYKERFGKEVPTNTHLFEE